MFSHWKKKGPALQALCERRAIFFLFLKLRRGNLLRGSKPLIVVTNPEATNLMQSAIMMINLILRWSLKIFWWLLGPPLLISQGTAVHIERSVRNCTKCGKEKEKNDIEWCRTLHRDIFVRKVYGHLQWKTLYAGSKE